VQNPLQAEAEAPHHARRNQDAEAVFGRAEQQRDAHQNAEDRSDEREIAPAFVPGKPQAERDEGQHDRLFEGPGEIEQQARVCEAEAWLAGDDPEGDHDQRSGGHIRADHQCPVFNQRSAEPKAHGEGERKAAGRAAQIEQPAHQPPLCQRTGQGEEQGELASPGEDAAVNRADQAEDGGISAIEEVVIKRERKGRREGPWIEGPVIHQAPDGVDHRRLGGGGTEERAVAPDADNADQIDDEIQREKGHDSHGPAAGEGAVGIARKVVHGLS
jgi:hypothetical protein